MHVDEYAREKRGFEATHAIQQVARRKKRNAIKLTKTATHELIDRPRFSISILDLELPRAEKKQHTSATPSTDEILH